MFTIAMRIAALLVNVFIFLCAARVILGWFSFPSSYRMGPIERALGLACDWYFRLFSRISLLRRGPFDFSPSFAILCLVLVSAVLNMLSALGRIAFGPLAGLILTALWSIFAFLLVILIILLVVRLAAFALRLNTFGAFLKAVEAVSDPVLFRIKRIVFGKRIVRYWLGLLTAILVLGTLWLLGSLVTGYARTLLESLPF